MEGGHAPVVAAPGRLVGAGERRADHDGVGTHDDGLGDVAAGAHAAVGDDLDVLARLLEVVGARLGDVRDGGGLRDADAQHAARRARVARADADQHALRAGAHEVEAGRVRRAAADHDGNRDLAGELLEVERLGRLRDVLRRDDRALDDQDVEAGLERDLVELAHLLRRQRCGADDALVLDLADALGHELGLDRLLVDLLHLPRRRLLRERRDLLERLVGVLEARPDALEVEDGEAAELAEDARRLGRDDTVHGRRQQWKLEAIGAERPADVDVVGVARAA